MRDSHRSLPAVLWQARGLLVLTALLSAVIAYGASQLLPPTYEASARLLLVDPRTSGRYGDNAMVIDPTRYARNQAQKIRSRAVLEAALARSGAALSRTEFEEVVEVTPSTELDLITVTALGPSAQEAARRADAVAEAFQDVESASVRSDARREVQGLAADVEQLDQRISAAQEELTAAAGGEARPAALDVLIEQRSALQDRIRSIDTESSLFGAGVDLFEAAEEPRQPSSPRSLLNAAAAAVLATIAAGGITWLRGEHNQGADRRQDPALILGAPLLGEVPDFAALGLADTTPAAHAHTSLAGESYQFLLGALGHALEQVGGSTVVVTSAMPSDGKTVTALNLAITAARDGRRVMLVDADERMRALSRQGRLSDAPGLIDLADDDVPLARCISSAALTSQARLVFVPAGTAVDDPGAFFRTSGFRKALMRVREQAELVVIDSPPLLAVSDTSAIASQADGIVLVVPRGLPLRYLEEVAERLAFIGTPLLGYVYNRAKPDQARRYAYGPDLARI